MKIGVVIYKNVNAPILKTSFEGGDAVIETHRYCLDTNVPISKAEIEQITKYITKKLKKGISL